MRQSKLFTKAKKEDVRGEEAKNAQLLMRAGFVNKEMAGVYSFLPLGLRVLERISDVVRQEMNSSLDAQEVLMPAIHPLKNYVATNRDKIDVLFHTKLNGGGDLVMGQSHEEIVVPLFANFAFSYKDLPCGIYQIQSKFRNELRAKSGILRGREFLMKDLYSFHENEECFKRYYEKSQKVYYDTYKKLGIGDRTYLTFASGGSFSKYSHEFQMISEVGEDDIYFCESCQIGVNREIIDDVKGCPECGKAKSDLVVKKSIEVGNIFPLGTRFAESFNFTIKDSKGNDIFPVMGCYGIGISRVMGSVVEALSDDKGIVWPKEISPFLVHLISIKGAEEETEKIYEELMRLGVDVLYDDRDSSPGEKFSESDLMGIPYRFVVSKKTLEKDSVEVKKRTEERVEFIKIKSITSYVEQII